MIERHCAASSVQVALDCLKARGVAMPLHLRCVSDNATGETKNSTTFLWMSWLVARGVFASGMLAQGRVGHTHGRQDRTFAFAARGLTRSRVLQDPADFAERLRATLSPHCKAYAILHVEKIEASMRWTDFFSTLPASLKFGGHTQHKAATDRGEEACHVFKFVTRQSCSGLTINTPFPDAPPHPSDVVLLLKLHMSSTSLAQPPMICFPHAFLELLPPKVSEQPNLRVPLTDRQKKEFLKTARLVEQAPWQLRRAAQYLRTLVEENTAAMSSRWVLPKIMWLLHGLERPQHDAPAIEQVFDLGFAVTKPLEVTIRGGAESLPIGRRMTGKHTPIGRRMTGKHTARRSPGATVKGAPPASRAVETGAPPGSTIAAAEHVAPAAAAESVIPRPKAGPGAGAVAAASAGDACPAASRSKRRRVVHVPADVEVGCAKCRFGAKGCARCREKAGLVDMGDGRWLSPGDVGKG